VIRRHGPFLILLGFGVVLRVLVMVAYRPAIFYIDSFASYLLPLSTLHPTGPDPIGYDLYLLGPALQVGDLATVVAVQHLLGLGMAVAGYVLLRRKGAGRWLAALATAPVLLDAYQVQIEHNLMSDPLFEALVLAALVGLAWPGRPGWRHVAAAGLLLGLAATVRQVGEVLILPLVLYAVRAAGGRWRRRVALGAVALACCARTCSPTRCSARCTRSPTGTSTGPTSRRCGRACAGASPSGPEPDAARTGRRERRRSPGGGRGGDGAGCQAGSRAGTDDRAAGGGQGDAGRADRGAFRHSAHRHRRAAARPRGPADPARPGGAPAPRPG